MKVITYPIEQFDELNINPILLSEIIKVNKSQNLEKIRLCNEYYAGNHEVLKRRKKSLVAPNHKVVCNHAKDISDTATGYFLSSSITYACSEEFMNELDKLTTMFDIANVDEVDHDNALDMSKLGIAYEYVYVKQGELTLVSKNIDPMTTIMVYDDTIEQNELFAIYYSVEKSPIDKVSDVYKAVILTKNYTYNVHVSASGELLWSDSEALPHTFEEIPLIVYQNNKDCFGDFQQQIPLIDAYNVLTSDRINDKEQFLDALLVLYGSRLGDDMEETSEAMKLLREDKILELGEGAKAEYLLRQFDESGVEILRKALKEDIYSFSHVPNMSDSNFAGNSSGVAMEYKLLPLESITKTKSRYYTKGLKKRMRLYASHAGLQELVSGAGAITPTFKRGLPKNLLELSQVIANLQGFVSKKTLLNQIPFVEDPERELKEAQKESNELLQLDKTVYEAPFTKNDEPVVDEQ